MESRQKLSFMARINQFFLRRTPKREHGALTVYNDLARSRDHKHAKTLFSKVEAALDLVHSYGPQVERSIKGVAFENVPGRLWKFDNELKISYISAFILLNASPIDVAMIIVSHASAARLLQKGVKVSPDNTDRLNEIIRNRVIAFLRRVPHASERHHQKANELVPFKIVSADQARRQQRQELDAYYLPRWLKTLLDRGIAWAERREKMRS